MENIRFGKLIAGLTMGFVLGAATLVPADAAAQTSRRQKSKNQWRNLAIGGGAAGVAGLLTKNKVLTYGGLAGGAYSLWRYEQDRKSQRAEQDRNRFRRDSRNRNRDWNGRGQRFSTPDRYGRNRHGYVNDWRHDNGYHNGWSKKGKGYKQGRH